MNNDEHRQHPMLLSDWIVHQNKEQFPSHGAIDYRKRLGNITEYLNNEVHPHVEKGALLKGDGYLTDHGPRHIETVIERASWLLSEPSATYPQLSSYEVYLLLLAIHFHDIGNIYGREEHETRHAEIMRELNSLVGDEMVEKNAILKIARAHGGRVNGSKDTISELLSSDPVLGKDVRYQTLAAILRFADELADDSRRASRIVERLDLIPEGSEVYHAYARSLHSVNVRPRENRVDLRYCFERPDAMRTFGKQVSRDNISNVYLLDEIFERTLKMHFERQYCMRFMHRVAQIEAVDVRIDVYEDAYSMAPCTDPIGYRLQDRGYPDTSSMDIAKICPDVKIDGAQLERELKEDNGNGRLRPTE